MQQNPWDTGSRLYRTLLLSGMAAIFVGIVLSVVATSTQATGLYWPALILMGAGLVTHIVAQVIRFRDARRRNQIGSTPHR